MAEPPLLAGADQLNETLPLPGVAEPKMGAPGTVAGVTEPEAALTGLVPNEFTAYTSKVYGVPFVNPVTVAEVALETASTNCV